MSDLGDCDERDAAIFLLHGILLKTTNVDTIVIDTDEDDDKDKRSFFSCTCTLPGIFLPKLQEIKLHDSAVWMRKCSYSADSSLHHFAMY